MKRIEIDLNPKKKHTLSEDFQKIVVFAPLAILLAAVIFILLIILQVVVVQKQAKLGGVRKQEEIWSEKASIVQAIRTDIFELEKEKNILQGVIVSEDEVAKILNDVFLSIPKNIWLEQFNLDEQSISLSGCVVRWKEDPLGSLEKFINSLRKKKYFSLKFKKVHIKDSKKVNFSGTEVLKFDIECKK